MEHTATNLIALLGQRNNVLSRVIEGPTDASTLTQTVSVSRSTIDRALSAFEEWGLIVSESDQIKPTLFARLVGTVYTDFETEVEAAARQQSAAPEWGIDGGDTVRLVTTRIDFLEHAATARTKRTFVAELPYARSTVDRAIRELEQAGLIQRTAAGYVATAIGHWVTARFRVTHRVTADVLAVRDLLRYLPIDEAFPPALFAGIDVEHAEKTIPYHLLDGVRGHLVTAERVRAVIPTLSTPQFLSICHRQVVQHGTMLELITTPALADVLTDEFPGLLTEMVDAGTATTFTAATPPFGLILSTTATEQRGSILVYNDRQSVAGAFHADNNTALALIDDYYEDIHEQATETTDDWTAATPTEASIHRVLSTNSDRVRRKDDPPNKDEYNFIYKN